VVLTIEALRRASIPKCFMKLTGTCWSLKNLLVLHFIEKLTRHLKW